MEWWGEIWLNEAFPTFMQNLAVDAVSLDIKLNSIGRDFYPKVHFRWLRSST